MKTCKKLLAITIALVLLVSTLVSGLVVSAAEVGTLVLTSQPITESDADQTVTVDLTFDYTEAVAAPHNLVTLSTDSTFVLESIVVTSVNGIAASEYDTETDPEGEVSANPCPIYIKENGINLSEGKFILEAITVDSNSIEDVVITATYTIPANTVAGKYPVTATADYTDYYECDDTLGITNCDIVVEAAVVEPECEHEWVVVEANPATADASHAETAKGSIDFHCSKCDETKTEEVSYYRYYACASTNAAYESEIQFQLNARKAHLTRQGAYEEAFIKIVKSYATDDAPVVKYLSTADAEEKNVSGNDCFVWSIGIPAKELNDNINANVYVKFNGAWYSGQPTNKSVVEYAMNVIGGASETEKALIANMLNYGAKAQTFFNYNVENPADANLGEYASYVTAGTASAVDSYVNKYNTANSEVILHKFNLEMASKVGLRAYFRTDYYKSGALDDLKVTASYETSAGTSSTTYTADDYVLETGRTDRYTFNYDVIPAKFMRAKVTLIAYNGDTQVSTTVTHSIESLVARLWDTISAEEQAVYSAMLNFGDAAAAHFVV